MPQSWELCHSGPVLCATIHTESTTIAWAYGLRNLIIPGSFAPMGVSGLPYDHARNVACMAAIEHDADWLFFLDSDVIPPRDTILRLTKHNKPIVSGVYCRRSNPVAVPVMLKDGQWIVDLPKNQLIDVDLVGAGCLLIHRDVLTTLPPQRPGKHWFDWRVDMKGICIPQECLSEDFTFCYHAKKHGFDVLVDTSIHCKHVGFSQVTYGQMGPLEALSIT